MEVTSEAGTPNEFEAKAASQPVLEVRDLSVQIQVDAADEIHPLSEVNLRINRGEAIGLLGESGAGKTTLALALMRMLPPSGRVTQGSIEFEGLPLLSLGERALRNIRGSRMSLIYQDSMVLNPVMRVGEQLVEVVRAHKDWTRRRCRERAIALLEDVELRPADRFYKAYPHQLSGGQRQRIVIAQALSCEPALVIADEPTASLDPSTASEIVELLVRLKQHGHTAFLVISHDLAPLARLADRIAVMYGGRIVEQGPCEEVLNQPLHPYTRALLACVVSPNTVNIPASGKGPMPTIPGAPPDLMCRESGCDFAERCEDRMDICCVQDPGEIRVSAARTVRCLKFGG